MGADGAIATRSTRSSGRDACCINHVAFNEIITCAHSNLSNMVRFAAHQFGASIFDAQIEGLRFLVGDFTSCKPGLEVLFCAKHSLLQQNALFILEPLCAPLTNN